ncbi:AMP-binding protein [Tsukamurella tyrosinosolvens]|uniref:class I adenylate-forming enzyme family protein n=1 Tax=Tsukamurella tyrosinosolvens TaxID=57704 RepID=UPI00079C7CB3|nr:AMP-binding protein [Tsukamurella tyrosinosolvens]KXP02539.1 AMP-dependent synthetase [Tsukamurella tyrosinosolvens]KZL96677.1 AMP-dependent synthetase [Tsukamurella tyrosinosolvens]MCA4996583.1 AMP-binding protein [Tsukamurella tyrosinosolvens]WEL93921.1 AMP-binding protein [Tsukamurella tyrosinosolvens]
MHFALLPAHRARTAPSAPAVADDLRSLDNATFEQVIAHASGTLACRGVGPGDVVAVLLPNTADLIVTLFAAWRLGAAVTPINPALTADEVRYQVTDAGSSVLVTDNDRGDGLGAPPLLTCDLGEARTAPVVAAHDDDLALLIYTSGTTGRPKGVRLDHANLSAQCDSVVAALGLTPTDHSLLILPLFHANGIIAGTLSPLLAGGRTTVAGRFRPETFFAQVEQARPTYFSAVPTIYQMLADLPADVRPDTSSIRFGVCGAAPASVELLAKVEQRFGFPLVEGYGLSECTCVATVNPFDGVRKPGTVGPAIPGVTVEVLDADGARLPAGEAGDVVISGPNVMRGYLNRPDETAATLVGGRLRTGDIGFLDEDGYLTLVDRAKDIIIRGGENIYPKEIESVVYQLPGVAEAAVVGRPDPKFGEVPVLFVALSEGTPLEPDEILAHAAQKLAKYKLPVEITTLPSLPKNAVGKLDKPTLRTRTSPPVAAS